MKPETASLDPYRIFSLPSSATDDDIRRRYKELALKLHPDRHPPETRQEAERAFKDVRAAHDILSDPARRKLYDLSRQKAETKPRSQPAPRCQQARNSAVDILDDLFSNPFFPNPFEPYTSHAPTKSLPHDPISITVTLEDLALSRTKNLYVTRTRLQPGTSLKVKERKHVPVLLHPEMQSGTIITLQNGGDEVRRGLFRDLTLKIQVAPHPRFNRLGLDLQTTVTITEQQALDGASGVMIEGIDSRPIDLSKFIRKRPIQNDSWFLLSGLGMPSSKGKPPGNLVVKVSVSVRPPGTKTDNGRMPSVEIEEVPIPKQPSSGFESRKRRRADPEPINKHHSRSASVTSVPDSPPPKRTRPTRSSPKPPPQVQRSKTEMDAVPPPRANSTGRKANESAAYTPSSERTSKDKFPPSAFPFTADRRDPEPTTPFAPPTPKAASAHPGSPSPPMTVRDSPPDVVDEVSDPEPMTSSSFTQRNPADFQTDQRGRTSSKKADSTRGSAGHAFLSAWSRMGSGASSGSHSDPTAPTAPRRTSSSAQKQKSPNGGYTNKPNGQSSETLNFDSPFEFGDQTPLQPDRSSEWSKRAEPTSPLSVADTLDYEPANPKPGINKRPRHSHAKSFSPGNPTSPREESVYVGSEDERGEGSKGNYHYDDEDDVVIPDSQAPTSRAVPHSNSSPRPATSSFRDSSARGDDHGRTHNDASPGFDDFSFTGGDYYDDRRFDVSSDGPWGIYADLARPTSAEGNTASDSTRQNGHPPPPDKYPSTSSLGGGSRLPASTPADAASAPHQQPHKVGTDPRPPGAHRLGGRGDWSPPPPPRAPQRRVELGGSSGEPGPDGAAAALQGFLRGVARARGQGAGTVEDPIVVD